MALRFGELDDDLDIVIPPLEGACKVLRPLSSSDQPVQPRTVRLSQGFASLIPVPLVGVDAADDDIVLQDRLCCHIASDGTGPPITASDTRKANDPARRYLLYGIGYDRSSAGAFDDDVRPESNTSDGTGVVRGSQRAHHFRFETRFHSIKNMNFQPPLHSEQGCEQANWARTGHKYCSRIPKGTSADRVDLFPRLGDNGCRLEQNA